MLIRTIPCKKRERDTKCICPPRFGSGGVCSTATERLQCGEKTVKKQKVTSFLYLNGGKSRDAWVGAKSFLFVSKNRVFFYVFVAIEGRLVALCCLPLLILKQRSSEVKNITARLDALQVRAAEVERSITPLTSPRVTVNIFKFDTQHCVVSVCFSQGSAHVSHPTRHVCKTAGPVSTSSY